MSAKVGLRKGNGKGGVGGEVEGGISFAPVPSRVSASDYNQVMSCKYLITAMLTGAVVLARYISLSAIVEAVNVSSNHRDKIDRCLLSAK